MKSRNWIWLLGNCGGFFAEQVFALVVVADSELTLLLKVEMGWKVADGVYDFLNETFPVYFEAAFQLT